MPFDIQRTKKTIDMSEVLITDDELQELILEHLRKKHRRLPPDDKLTIQFDVGYDTREEEAYFNGVKITWREEDEVKTTTKARSRRTAQPVPQVSERSSAGLEE